MSDRAGLDAAIADELVDLTIALGDLAYDLGSDAETARKHIGSLQAIDLLTQVHLALADLLRSDAPVGERIAAVPLEALAARLAAKVEGDALDRAGAEADEFFG